MNTGILLLHGNKTYGRSPNGRLYYRCIPTNDKKENQKPLYLPFDIKASFSKVYTNKYVVYERTKGEPEKGKIIETIGDVNQEEAFYTYEMRRRGLYRSTQGLYKRLLQIQTIPYPYPYPSYPFIEDRTQQTEEVITVDGEHTTDRDDAFSIKTLPNGNIIVSVHIINPYPFIETHDIWQEITPPEHRTTSLYLPNSRIPMFPTIMTERFVNFNKGSQHVALTMDIIMNRDYEEVGEPTFHITLIRIDRNTHYIDILLDRHPLFIMTKKLLHIEKKREREEENKEVVAYWMVKMAYSSASYLMKNREPNALFHYQHYQKHDEHIVHRRFYLSSSLFSSSIENTENPDTTTTKPYMYITSPLRRIIDMYNITIMTICIMKNEPTEETRRFIEVLRTETTRDIIERDYKQSKRLQMETGLYAFFCSNENKHQQEEYEGIIIEVFPTKKENYYSYTVFIPYLRLYVKTKEENTILLGVGSKQRYKIVVFEREDTFQKKIRIQRI